MAEICESQIRNDPDHLQYVGYEFKSKKSSDRMIHFFILCAIIPSLLIAAMFSLTQPRNSRIYIELVFFLDV